MENIFAVVVVEFKLYGVQLNDDANIRCLNPIEILCDLNLRLWCFWIILSILANDVKWSIIM